MMNKRARLRQARALAVLCTIVASVCALAQPVPPSPSSITDTAKKLGIAFPVAPVSQSDAAAPKAEREQLLAVPRLPTAVPSAKADSLTERPVGKPSAAPSREVDVLGDRKVPVASTAVGASAARGINPPSVQANQFSAGPMSPSVSGAPLAKPVHSPVAAVNSGVAALALNTQSQNTASHIAVAPGVTEIIPIAKNALNRVVTSFENAKARHSLPRDAGASITAHGSVVYVGTYTEQPITTFIVDADDESRAISVVFVPRDIPPREIFIAYSKPVVGNASGVSGTATMPTTSQNAKEAQAWEEGQPYVDMLKAMLRTLALGELPPGYNLIDAQTSRLPRCSSPALRTTLGQVIEGSRFTVAVHRAENTSQQSVHVNESGCYYPGVIAVGAWPRAHLNAGEDTEIFVIHRKDQPMSRNTSRPSLVQTQGVE